MENNKIPTVQSSSISLLDDEPELPLSSAQSPVQAPFQIDAMPSNTPLSGRKVAKTSRKPMTMVPRKITAKKTPTKTKKVQKSKMATMIARTFEAVLKRMAVTKASSKTKKKSLPSSSSSSQSMTGPKKRNKAEIPEAKQIRVEDNDVVLNLEFRHEGAMGNCRMVSYVRRRALAYLYASSEEKRAVFVKDVVRDVEGRGGRFLVRQHDGPWTLADKESAYSRVLEVFRSICSSPTPQEGHSVMKVATVKTTKKTKTMTGMPRTASPSVPLWPKLTCESHKERVAVRSNNAWKGTTTNSGSSGRKHDVGLGAKFPPPPMKQRDLTPSQQVCEKYPWLMPLIDCAAMEEDFPEYKTHDDDDDDNLDWTNVW